MPTTSDAAGWFRRRGPEAALAVLAGVVFLGALGSVDLWGKREQRAAAEAVDTIDHHHWLVARLQGTPRLEKPPLPRWTIAALIALTGRRDEWVVRLPGAGLGRWGMVAAGLRPGVAGWASRVSVGLSAGLALTSMGFFISELRQAGNDGPLAFFTTLALYAAWRRLHAVGAGAAAGSKRWNLLFYAAMGLGFLCKGPIVVAIVAVTVVPYLACVGRLRGGLALLADGRGLALFLLLAMSWPVPVLAGDPNAWTVWLLEMGQKTGGASIPHPHKRAPLAADWPWMTAPWAAVATLALAAPLRGRGARVFWRSLFPAQPREDSPPESRSDRSPSPDPGGRGRVRSTEPREQPGPTPPSPASGRGRVMTGDAGSGRQSRGGSPAGIRCGGPGTGFGFAWWWSAGNLMMFGFWSVAKPSYFLPCLPEARAVLCGVEWRIRLWPGGGRAGRPAGRGAARARVLQAHWVALFVAAALAPGVAWRLAPGAVGWVAACAAVLAAAVVVSARAWRRGADAMALAPLVGAAAVLVVVGYGALAPAENDRRGHRPLADALERRLPADARTVMFFHEVDEGLWFYLKGRDLVAIPGTRAGYNDTYEAVEAMRTRRYERDPAKRVDAQRRAAPPSSWLRRGDRPTSYVLIRDAYYDLFARSLDGLAVYPSTASRGLRPQRPWSCSARDDGPGGRDLGPQGTDPVQSGYQSPVWTIGSGRGKEEDEKGKGPEVRTNAGRKEPGLIPCPLPFALCPLPFSSSSSFSPSPRCASVLSATCCILGVAIMKPDSICDDDQRRRHEHEVVHRPRNDSPTVV